MAMVNVCKGALVGAANVVAVAAVTAVTLGRENSGEVFAILAVAGLLPGLLVGALLGWICGRLRELRLFVTGLLAVMAVILLGACTVPLLIAPALLPTVGFCCVLERWTRAGSAPLT